MIGEEATSSSSSPRLQLPWGIAYNPPNQEILVSDGDNHRVHRFKFDFQHRRIEFLSTIGAKGGGLLYFDHPKGLCYQPFTHHILICDELNNRIQILNQNGTKHLFSVGSPRRIRSRANGEFNRPYGINCQLDGSVMVADSVNQRMQILDARGVFVRKCGGQDQNHDQIDASGDSNKDSQHRLKFPHDVCVLESRWNSLTSSPSPQILVADYGNKRVSIWNKDGSQHITNFQVSGWPLGLCVDLNGFVHVACGGDHNVQVYEPRNNYSLVQQLGHKGHAPGELNWPSGLAVDEFNTLMVVEFGNNRVQFFRG